jgi:hypothetical protein
MTFNRHATLVKHYKNEVSGWDWAKIKEAALENCRTNDDQDSVYGISWLGTPLGIYPSGKIYAFWTSNQTRADVAKDEAFIEALEAVAEEQGMFIDYDEDIFACIHVTNKEEVKGFITSEDADLAEQIFGG